MTIEEKKEVLNQYRRLDEEIKLELEELAKWKALSCKITPTYSHTKSGGNVQDRVQNAYDKIEKLSEQINGDIDKMVELRETIVRCIEQIEEYSLRALLKYHYINQMSLDEIAEKMSYCYRQITRLHRKALQQLQIPQEGSQQQSDGG